MLVRDQRVPDRPPGTVDDRLDEQSLYLFEALRNRVGQADTRGPRGRIAARSRAGRDG